MAEQFKADDGRRAFAGGRRVFMAKMGLLAGASLAGSSLDLAGSPQRKAMTVRQVIAALLADIPGAPFPNTVDTIKAGDPDQEVKGIVTTMFATDEVIGKTIRLGANFIIAHEPTFYNHEDETKWLGDDEVLRGKQEVLKAHGITVWRFHDGIHQHHPDGIRMGVMQALGWKKLYNPSDPPLVEAPAAALGEMIAMLKKRLGIGHLKYIGDPHQNCSRIVLLPGAPGGQVQIGAIRKYQPDLLITGELNEWETSEYVRDARFLGGKVALVVLGHSVSEEPGMEWLVPVLRQKAPGIPVMHIVSGDAFSWA